jgi:carbon monoxide dehydrogenase subunit G
MSASALVAAPPEEVFAFLSDLENHWSLADRFVEVLDLEVASGIATGGRVRVHGPLGLGRTATTRVVGREPNRSLAGTATLSGGTHAMVRWTLEPVDAKTRVELSAHVERAGRLDRFLLAAGGRRWIRRRFAAILATLARRFD